MEGDPILLDQSIPKHNETAEKVANWRSKFDGFGKMLIGEASSSLEADCFNLVGLCPMGDLITDAMLANREKFGVQATLFNSGGIRASFDAGNITFSDCVSVLPFGNVLVISVPS